MTPQIATGTLALQAWEDSVNAAGGIDGHQIKIYMAADDYSPATALAAVKGLVTNDHVVAIIDNSYLDFSFASYISTVHVPVLQASPQSAPFYTNADFFPNGATSDWLPPLDAVAIKTANLTAVALFSCNAVAQCAALIPPSKAAAEAEGLKFVYGEEVSPSAPSYAANCIAAKQGGADALIIFNPAPTVMRVVQDCKQQGFSPTPILGNSNINQSILSDPNMNGQITLFNNLPYFVNNTPATEAMYAAFAKYAPNLTTNQYFGQTAVATWIAAQLFAAAAKAGNLGDNPAAAGILHGLYALNKETLGGQTPPLTYNQGAPNSINCGFLAVQKGSQLQLLTGTTPVCATSTAGKLSNG